MKEFHGQTEKELDSVIMSAQLHKNSIEMSTNYITFWAIINYIYIQYCDKEMEHKAVKKEWDIKMWKRNGTL